MIHAGRHFLISAAMGTVTALAKKTFLLIDQNGNWQTA